MGIAVVEGIHALGRDIRRPVRRQREEAEVKPRAAADDVVIADGGDDGRSRENRSGVAEETVPFVALIAIFNQIAGASSGRRKLLY